MSTTDDFVSFS